MSELNGQVILIDINQIEVPDYPRFHSQEELEDLAADIKRNNRQIEEGVVEPNVNREEKNTDHGSQSTDHVPQKPWRLIVGWGRFQALKMIGWTQMRCLVAENMSKLQKLQIM